MFGKIKDLLGLPRSPRHEPQPPSHDYLLAASRDAIGQRRSIAALADACRYALARIEEGDFDRADVAGRIRSALATLPPPEPPAPWPHRQDREPLA